MTSPTVDRLGALGAVAEKAKAYLDATLWDPTGLDSLYARNALNAALDAASPLAAPAPDQGALERAREIFRLMTSSSNPNDHITALAAALTAAEVKARAAALFEVECELIGYHSALRANEDRPGITAHECAIIDCAIARVRALATPAQSET